MKRSLIFFALLALIFCITLGTADAQRPVLRFKYSDFTIYTNWVANRLSNNPDDSLCQDNIFVGVFTNKEVVWDRDSKQHQTFEVAPELSYTVNTWNECPTELINVPSDRTSLSKGQVRFNGLSGASVDIDDVYASDGLYALSADIHLRWNGQGNIKTKNNLCSVIPDPETNTCLKVAGRFQSRAQTLTGDFSGILTIPGAIGIPTENRFIDWTPGNFSYADPESILISRLDLKQVTVLDLDGGGCNCPDPHEEIELTAQP